ncbi:molybdopterin-containing oxidoreductase family protein [Moorella sulfitireducens]|uniref:molybdopterin-containing oxidoreductase family protein n=1 Tax=Neomoorella sulfitireducens TaxID=2972948 RepID=UPI0021ACA814|nr:molybdopterin-dependent oxidoreductase [Moorella sulfitireducens]
MADSETRVVRTTVWSPGPGCHGGCGAKLYVKDGRLVKVEGDEDHPFNQGRACPRLLALTQYVYHPERLLYPMKRVGARGEGKWERITWDEALDTIEKKLKDIRDEYGPESVLFCQGTGRDIGGPISFLAYSYGSPNWVQLGLAGQSCYTPRLAAMSVTFGDFAVLDAGQFFVERYESKEWQPPKCIIIWAQNPMSGCPDAFQGHWIVECMKRGSELIVIDPRWTWFASRSKYFLQIRPGTDGALALGMINVIINEGLYDKEFVEQWTYGFDALKERVKEFTPERVSAITWVPADLIIAAARFYASSKPAAIHWGLPVDQCPEGTTVAQAITHLWCLTGNLDVPGGNVIARASHNVTTYPFDSHQLLSLYGEELVKKLSEKRIGAQRYGMVRNFRGWAQPDMAIEQILTGDPYPIKAAWIQTTNILGGQAADLRKHYEALKKLDFIVAADTFMNPTIMALADIVLPVATFAEKESFRSWWAPLSVVVPAVKVGECRSDWEINLELARRFNPEGIPWKTVKELINERLKPSGKTFDELAAQGSWEMPPEGHPSRPYRRYEKGLLRPDGKPGFRTPTGKVEFYSKTLEEWGLDPLPYYEEPPESEVRTPELFKKYPLIMATGRRSPVYFHAEHRMIPWLREIDPDPIIEINTSTAKEMGIEDGEWVWIENDRGRIKRKARVTPIIHPKVVMVPHGWWLPETEGKEPYLYGIWEYNCNLLIPIGTQGKSGFGGGAYKTTLCRIRKMEKGEV